MGQSPSSKNYSNNKKDTILIQGNADLISGKVVPRVYTSEITKVSNPGDIILTVRAPVGDLAINDFNSCIGRGVCSIEGDKFVYYFLQSLKDKHILEKFSQGSTFESINSNDIKNLNIATPSKSTQNNISNFFTKIDEKIELLDNKHKQYQNFKQYLMQQIFSQKLRFEIVKGGYEEYLISDLFDSKKGSGLSKKDIVDDGSNKCILYGELYTIYSEIIDEVQSRTNSECSCLSKKGDILIPTSTTTNGIDLVTASVIFENNVYLGGDITILRNKDESIVNNSYFAYYFSNGLIEEVSRLTQGSTIIHLYWKDFKKVKVKIPSVAEQEKITSMFQFLDKKLGNIGYAVESMREFKKGLLQQMFI